MKDITIIIPLGENKEFSALESLKKQKDKIDFIIEVGTNPSKNRNEGIKRAKTKYVAFINGHTIIKKNWAEEVEKFFLEHPQIDIVGGPQLTPDEDNPFAKISGYSLSSIFGAGEVSRRYKIIKKNLNVNEKYLTSSNLICKKNVFDKVLFDEKIYPGEDPKFISDTIKSGFKIAYSPDIIVYNKRRDSLKGLIKQIFNYGLMRPRKESWYELIKNFLFLIPSFFLLYLLLLPTLFIIDDIFITPLFFYLTLNLFFSAYESIRNKEWRAIFLLPFLFFTIHVSYGLGFLSGIAMKLKEKFFI